MCVFKSFFARGFMKLRMEAHAYNSSSGWAETRGWQTESPLGPHKDALEEQRRLCSPSFSEPNLPRTETHARGLV